MIASWHSKSLVSLDTSQVEWPNGLLFKWRFVRPKCRTIGRLAEGKKESLVSPSNGAAQQKGCNAHANSGPSQQNNNSTKICEISVLWLWVKVWLVSLLLNLKFNTQAEWPWSWVENIQKCSKGGLAAHPHGEPGKSRERRSEIIIIITYIAPVLFRRIVLKMVIAVGALWHVL